jgi:CheY-like chemotaxis protein
MARVVALVPDLLFGSRVQSMLALAGHEVELVGDVERASAALGDAEVLVVDLTVDGLDPAELLRGLALDGRASSGGKSPDMSAGVQAAHADGPRAHTLGFYAHVDAQTRERALAAGFDLVVPRSRMAREGAELVGRLLAGEAS